MEMTTSWHSYPSIYNLGHRAVADILLGPVYVEEKVDGSQFSFGVFEIDGQKELRVRSKGATMLPEAPEKMFSLGVEHVKSIQHLLTVGYTYRGEYLRSPKHNSLVYSRIPAGHIILFDINSGHEEYLSYSAKKEEAERIGLEIVPLVFEGVISDIGKFREFLDRESLLGGQKIEGVVVKPVGSHLFGQDKKALFAKFVSEHFKEVHSKEWKTSNPTQNDIIEKLGMEYRTPARWQKAVLHLTEKGLLTDSPKDIGLLIREVPADVRKECEEEIKEQLWKWAWPHVSRKIVAGLPEYYKEQLLLKQPTAEGAACPNTTS